MDSFKNSCDDIESFSQVRQPRLSNIELVAINLTAKYMYINTELQLFRSLKGTYLIIFEELGLFIGYIVGISLFFKLKLRRRNKIIFVI